MHCLQPKGCPTIYLFLNLTEQSDRRIGCYASKDSFVRHRHSWKNQVQGRNLKTLVINCLTSGFSGERNADRRDQPQLI